MQHRQRRKRPTCLKLKERLKQRKRTPKRCCLFMVGLNLNGVASRLYGLPKATGVRTRLTRLRFIKSVTANELNSMLAVFHKNSILTLNLQYKNKSLKGSNTSRVATPLLAGLGLGTRSRIGIDLATPEKKYDSGTCTVTGYPLVFRCWGK